jgi:hypothetical protein
METSGQNGDFGSTPSYLPVCLGIGQVKIRSRLRCIRKESGERHDGFVRVILDGDWLVCGDAREDEEG